MPHTFSPPVQSGIDILSKERPELVKGAKIRPMGWLGRTFLPQAKGVMNPLTGTVSLNEAQMAGDAPQDVADTVLHELTHRQQRERSGPLRSLMNIMTPQGPYGQRPDELEAFQAEADRRMQMGRPGAFGTPHFETPTQETYGDIRLPESGGRKRQALASLRAVR